MLTKDRSGLYLASRVEDALEEDQFLQQRIDIEFRGMMRALASGELGAITASGLYGLSLEKMMIDTLGETIEAEDNKVLMVLDAEAPNFDTHDFRADIAQEVSGTGYTLGGVAMTGTEVTLASGLLTFDGNDVQWVSSTIANAMAGVFYTNVGSAATDQLISLHDFVTAASTTNGTFLIAWHANGLWTVDYTP